MPKRDPVLARFGRNVANLRDKAGLSQDKLAELAELDRNLGQRYGSQLTTANPPQFRWTRIARCDSTPLKILDNNPAS